MIPQDSRAPFRQQRWVQCRNDSGQDLAPNSLVAVTGAIRVSQTGATIVSVELPTATSPVALLAVTGLQTIPTGQDGQCTFDFPAYVKYSGGTPANGEEWGHDDGSDSIVPNKTGFRILGDQNGTVVRVMKEAGSTLIRFELTANLSLAGTATANLLDIDWVDTGTDITVRDPYTNPGCWQAYSGYKGFATMGANGIYDIVWMERRALIIYFTLTQDTNTSSGTTATVNSYFQQGDKDPGGTVLVYDVNSIYPRALNGAKGIAVWNDRTVRYEVLVCQQMGTLFWCDISSAFCPDEDPDITFGGRYQHSPFNQIPNPAPTTAANFYNLASPGTGNPKGLIGFDDANGTYDLFQVSPEEFEDIREMQVVCDTETSTAKLQGKGKKFYAYTCGEDGEWKDLGAIGTSVDNVIAVTWDGTDLDYEYQEQLVICQFDTGTVNIDTPEACPSE